MHITRVVIEGFRCYKHRLEPEPFSPHHNVVVGANGSGKSNFFAAISFVLGELTSGPLRADERKALLHEGAGAASTSAFVQIHFDNSDGRLPVESKEVVIKRTVGIKKDDYYIDGKHVTKTEVASMLESAGLSKNNPHHIVPQGRVNALTMMKDEQRLEMLKEVAGSSTYDQRRVESLTIMNETARQKGRISETIAHIESRLKQLDADKAELAKCALRLLACPTRPGAPP